MTTEPTNDPAVGIADPAMNNAMVALSADVAGFIAAAVVRVTDNEIIGATSRFAALTGEQAAAALTGYLNSVGESFEAMGGQDLFGLFTSGAMMTEAATMHVRRVNTDHFLIVVTDPAPDAVVRHSTIDILDAYGPALAHLIL